MEVSLEKSKIMMKSTNTTILDIGMNGEKPGKFTSFKYLEVTLSNEMVPVPLKSE
ncbi:hypothetical protein DPMN_085701 [Dreissena polymorpha]|uniref:Uncharacterized protein n=1 Tax=Dreissena polymorpha TaxID=45954 RepID=A0A9D4BKI4_DREPO|nr:hypothetical protein DPMN_085701 [Dreissena polymorpha]